MELNFHLFLHNYLAIEKNKKTMLVHPNPKINIGLYITEKRTDGFHNIETVFYPVHDKKDRLSIELLSEGDTEVILENNAPQIEKEKNLCYRAWLLLKNDCFVPNVRIMLTKNIPIGAGLGGGSADAAFTLVTLNKMCNLGLSVEKLKQYAQKLGSDVPFFIENRPIFAHGRGEIMENIELDLSHKVITIIKPPFSISTAEAYNGAIPKKAPIDLKKAIQKPVHEWKNYIENDFEKILFPKYPFLKEIKEGLYENGAEYASLSGSGSALYAISDNIITFK